MALLLVPALGQAQDDGPKTWDGLVQIEDSDVHAALIDPDAEFAVFQRVSILRPHVAFRSNWQQALILFERIRSPKAVAVREQLVSLNSESASQQEIGSVN